MGFLGATAAGSGQITPCGVVVDAAVPQAAEGCESGFRVGGEVGGDYFDKFLLHWELGEGLADFFAFSALVRETFYC